jgi:hypothetical protein
LTSLIWTSRTKKYACLSRPLIAFGLDLSEPSVYCPSGQIQVFTCRVNENIASSIGFSNVSKPTFGVYPRGVLWEFVVDALGSLANEGGGDARWVDDGGEPTVGSAEADDGVGLDRLVVWRIAERNGGGR